MKKIIILLLSIVSLVWIISFITGYTQVIFVSKNPGYGILKDLSAHQAGDTVQIFKNLNFSDGQWKAYLLLSKEDGNDLSPELKKANCYVTSDTSLLNAMKRDWCFVVTGGDMSTVVNKLVLVRNGKTEFITGIVVDKSQEGFQNERYGWTAPTVNSILIKYCRQFERVIYPVVVF